MKSKSANDGQRESPLETALLLLGNRWSLRIVQCLFSGTKRYNELRSAIKGITSRTLTKHLRELEQHGILTRTVATEGPIRSDYSLTDLGRGLEPCCNELTTWSKKFRKRQETLQAKKTGASTKKLPTGSRRRTKRKHD